MAFVLLEDCGTHAKVGQRLPLVTAPPNQTSLEGSSALQNRFSGVGGQENPILPTRWKLRILPNIMHINMYTGKEVEPYN